MSHFSTRRWTNLSGSLIAGAIVIGLVVASGEWLIPWSLVGALAGIVGGVFQVLAWKQAGEALATASTALAVRKAYSGTRWGRRYLYFFWAFSLSLLLAGVLVARAAAMLCVAAGYLAFVALREATCFIKTFGERGAKAPGSVGR